MCSIIGNVYKNTYKQRKKREKEPIVKQEKIVIMHETNHNIDLFDSITFIFNIRDHGFAFRLFPTTGCIPRG